MCPVHCNIPVNEPSIIRWIDRPFLIRGSLNFARTFTLRLTCWNYCLCFAPALSSRKNSGRLSLCAPYVLEKRKRRYWTVDVVNDGGEWIWNDWTGDEWRWWMNGGGDELLISPIIHSSPLSLILPLMSFPVQSFHIQSICSPFLAGLGRRRNTPFESQTMKCLSFAFFT